MVGMITLRFFFARRYPSALPALKISAARIIIVIESFAEFEEALSVHQTKPFPAEVLCFRLIPSAEKCKLEYAN